MDKVWKLFWASPSSRVADGSELIVEVRPGVQRSRHVFKLVVEA